MVLNQHERTMIPMKCLLDLIKPVVLPGVQTAWFDSSTKYPEEPMRHATRLISFLLAAAFFAACSSSEPEQRPERDPKAVFSRMDGNQDRLLSWDEFKGMPSRMSNPEERFQRMDKDMDGYLTLEEFMDAQSEFRDRKGARRGQRNGRRGGGF